MPGQQFYYHFLLRSVIDVALDKVNDSGQINWTSGQASCSGVVGQHEMVSTFFCTFRFCFVWVGFFFHVKNNFLKARKDLKLGGYDVEVSWGVGGRGRV